MTSTDVTNKLTMLINELDHKLKDHGGYSLTFCGEGYAAGWVHHIKVQPFPRTLEDGQKIADILGLIFKQDTDERWPYSFEAQRDGVVYGFHLGKKDAADYPALITPKPQSFSDEALEELRRKLTGE